MHGWSSYEIRLTAGGEGVLYVCVCVQDWISPYEACYFQDVQVPRVALKYLA